MSEVIRTMVEWKNITKAEKMDKEFMQLQKELYKQLIDKKKCETKEDFTYLAKVKFEYIKICDAITSIDIAIDKKIEANKKELEKLLKAEAEDSKKKEVIEQRKLKINSSLMTIAELIKEYNIWQVGNGALCWYLQEVYLDEYGERKWTCLKKDTLQARFPQLDVYIRGEKGEADYSSFKEFTSAMGVANRIFTNLVQSWTKPTANGTLNILHNNFCNLSQDDEVTYHWFLDAVMESVSGGSDANTLEHLQKLFLAKYQHPENVFLPNIFCNDTGSTGKSLLVQQFTTRLFGGAVANNCNMEHLTGRFNSSIAGKALIFINETTHDQVDQDKLKAFLGSPTFKVEEKYERAVDADNCAMVFSAANGTSGAVRLTGDGSDRRYSIFSAKKPLYQVVSEYFLAKENKIVSLDDAKIWVETVGQHILHDADQVGKWLVAMTLKYGDIITLDAIKGKAYDDLLERQRGAWLDTVEEIFTQVDFEYITEQLLVDLVREVNKGELIPKKKTFAEYIEKMCKVKGIKVVKEAKVSVAIGGMPRKQKTVWKKDNGLMTVRGGEEAYRKRDEKDERWIWQWF